VSIVLELRGHTSHAGQTLVHTTSEDVVLSNVFGVVKNLPHDLVLSRWIDDVTGIRIRENQWHVSFWEKQEKPQWIDEGSTAVDLVLDCEDALVFVEVKMDAPASSGTRHNLDRNQLIRNLDVGYARANGKKQFAVIFLTPDVSEPDIIKSLHSRPAQFPVSRGIPSATVMKCLYWASWSTVSERVADAHQAGQLSPSEAAFALDLLAYMSKKGLWENTLTDDQVFYDDKLYRPLCRDGSPFQPYATRSAQRYQGWRRKSWDEQSLRDFLADLRIEDKALLKVIADAGGAIRQGDLMRMLPMLQGKTSASLRALKSHVNAGCKSRDCAQILSDGLGNGDNRIHQVNPQLGPLREVVIDVSRRFTIDWKLLKHDQ